MSHNINLCILSRFVLNRFSATGSVYGMVVSFSAKRHLLVTLFSRCSQLHLVIMSACVYASIRM